MDREQQLITVERAGYSLLQLEEKISRKSLAALLGMIWSVMSVVTLRRRTHWLGIRKMPQ
jgi:hypothetical protein